MKKLVLGAMVAVLCGTPALSRAELPGQRGAEAPAHQQAPPAVAPDGTRSEDEASDYAAREQASPELAEFSGGQRGIYIGSGALVAALLIVLLIVAL